MTNPRIEKNVRLAIERIDRLRFKLDDAFGDLSDLLDELRENDPNNATLKSVETCNTDAWTRFEPVGHSLYHLKQAANLSVTPDWRDSGILD